MFDPHIEVIQSAHGSPVLFFKSGDLLLEMSEDCARDLINKIFDAMCDNAIVDGMSKFSATPNGVK